MDLSEIARALGRRGGASKSAAKAAAARRNGLLGGRPRKDKPGAIAPGSSASVPEDGSVLPVQKLDTGAILGVPAQSQDVLRNTTP